MRKQTHISKVGNRHLRHALYMPALVASRNQPQVRDSYERLLQQGKKERQALLAVAGKLLRDLGNVADAATLRCPAFVCLYTC